MAAIINMNGLPFSPSTPVAAISFASAGVASPSSSAAASSPSLSSSSSGAPALTASVPRPSLTTAPRPVFIPRDELVVLPALPADPRYEKLGSINAKVTKADAAYNLKPDHCGEKVIWFNAQDPNFYLRRLKDPQLTVWVMVMTSDVIKSHACKRLFETGWRQNIQVIMKSTSKFELVSSKDGLEGILYEGSTIELPDCIINRVGQDVDYFGLAVIRQFEKMGVLIFNPLQSIEIARDKLLTVQHLAAHGLPIPKTVLAKFPVNMATISENFSYPIIVKKTRGRGIMKVDSQAQMEDLVAMFDDQQPLLLQEMIAPSYGRDLRVFVVGGRVVGAMRRTAPVGKLKANKSDAQLHRVALSAELEWLVLETVKIIGLDIAAVNLLIDSDSYRICQVNSSPRFRGLEIAEGIDMAGMIFQYMRMRLGLWRVRQKKKRLEMKIGSEHTDSHTESSASSAAISPSSSSSSHHNHHHNGITSSSSQSLGGAGIPSSPITLLLPPSTPLLSSSASAPSTIVPLSITSTTAAATTGSTTSVTANIGAAAVTPAVL